MMNSRFQNIADSVRNVFRKKQAEMTSPVPEKGTDKDEITKKLEQDFQDRLDAIQGISQNDETLIFTVNTHILATSSGYYGYFGRVDGRIGSRNYHVLSSARSHAERITGLVKAKLLGRIEALKQSELDQRKTLERQEELCRLNAVYLADIEEEEREDDKSFNLKQAWLYLAFGVLMIASDITVSLNLVNFFGIGDPDNQHSGLWNKLWDGELLFFSLGIAFCTVYVKILYDDYINTKTGSHHILRNKLMKKDISEDKLKRESLFKGVVKVLILIGLLGFLFSLAQFRAFHTKNDILAVHSTPSGASTGDIVDDANTAKGSSADEKQRSADQDRYLLYSFIGLSLMVPLISGIALSVGFRIIQRRRMLAKAKKMCADAEAERKAMQESVTAQTSRHVEFKAFSEEWEDSETKVENMAIFFANTYNQGFRESYRSHFGNDLYVIVEEYRNEVINQAFSKALTNSEK